MSELLVSIIIPSLNDEPKKLEGLLEDISCQKINFKTEVIKIFNVRPSGRARNMGAEKAKGELLIFFDCDIRLGNELILSNLINTLRENKFYSVVCASVRIPLNASDFQRRYADNISHCQVPIVESLTDVYIPTVACCAISKDLFFKLGMFNEKIKRGVDPEFAFRLKKEDFKAALVPHAWFYHAMPNNIIELIKIQARDALAVAFADTFYPEFNIDVDPRGIVYFSQRESKIKRAERFFRAFFNAVIKARVLLLFSKTIYALAYLFGILNYRVLFIFKRPAKRN